VKRVLLAVAVVIHLAAGCGGKETTPADTGTTTTPVATTEVRVYWLRDGKVWPALREVSGAGDLFGQLVGHLALGPGGQQEADLQFSTAIPSREIADGQTNISDIEGGVRIEFPAELSERALAQVVYTFTQFPDIHTVDIQGRTLTRADFEDYTPAILVESPLPFEEVSSPLRVTGTANTFEANFQYDLTDTDGLIVDQNFVTATSGTGTRGTFEFTTEPFTVPFDGVGALIVFESSAKDGSRINLVEIPLRMKR
jgi:germination protein M